MKASSKGLLNSSLSLSLSLSLCSSLLIYGILMSANQVVGQSDSIWVKFINKSDIPICTSGVCTSTDSTINQVIQQLGISDAQLVLPAIVNFPEASRYGLDCVYQLEIDFDVDDAIDSLNALSSSIRYAEPIPKHHLLYTPNDYDLQDTELGPNWQLDLIQAEDAWDVSGDVNGEIVIAIIEVQSGSTGNSVDINHEDLSDNVISALGEQPPTNIHATFVAGCASATTDNGQGISAIGYNAAIRGYYNHTPNGWLQAVADGVDIINLSFGGCSFSPTAATTAEMIADMGVIMIAAAGNGPDAIYTCGSGGMGYQYPASYDHVISVSSVCEDNTFYYADGAYHHTANDKVDICAPGYDVLSFSPESLYPPMYHRSSGTSFASPITAGLVALILKVNPCLKFEDVKTILQSTADPIDDAGNWPGILGAGRINAYQAVLMAQGYEAEPVVIVSPAVWDYEVSVYSDVIIETGATLTVTDKVNLAPDAKIIVKQNGRLIVDGGHLTNSNDCGEGFWQGIELWGDSDEPQISFGSGYKPQAILQLKNGGIIENAWVGVTTAEIGNPGASGGIIDARDGEFINNYIAVDMKPFQNTNQYTGNPKGNLSKFRETKFTVNNNYIGDLGTEWSEAQVKMHGVDGVTFSGCEFVNTTTVSTSEKRSKGIFSEDSNYRVQHQCASIPSVISGCPVEDIIPSVFDGFYRGIEATKVNDALPIKVVQSQFKNNMIGIELADLAFSEIIKSEFIIGGHPHQSGVLGEFENHLGIYSNRTLCFVIEENEFSKDPDSSWDEQNGVFVFNSGGNSNKVYLNEFTELKRGVIGYQVNRNGSGFIGLQFICNDMTDNFHDFVVSRTDLEGGYNDSGIRTFQGALSPNVSAGNEFSVPNGVPNEYTHWDINSATQYLYYHMPGEAPDLANEVTPNTMFIDEADFSNGCASNYSVGHQPAEGLPGVIGGFVQSKIDFYNTLYTYKQLIDDGDTEGTLSEIVATWPEDAWDLYDMLMARSPRNSESVLIVAADREIMPHAMLLEVLIANPDAIRNGSVIYHVENKLNNPMPGYMIDILHAAVNQKTLRTTIESTLAYHHAEMTRNYNFIIQHYTSSDTLNGVHADSLLYYLEQMDSPTGKYNLAGRLMRVGHITEAMNIIDSIPHNYRLTTYQTDEWKSMQALFELLEDADRNDRNIATLDSTQLVQLEMIATNPDGGTGALRARKALCFFYQNCIPGPALPKNKQIGHKKPLPPLEELLSELDKVSAFPNPASEYVTISYQFFKENAQREIFIYNPTGLLVHNFRLSDAQEGQQLWDTREMNPGTYIYEIIEGERKIHSDKIVIQ